MGTQPPTADRHTLIFETETDHPEQLLRFILESIDRGNLERVRIELEGQDPFSLNGVDIEQPASEEPPTEPEPEEEPEPEPDLEPPDGVVRFREDSNAYEVAKVLAERDDQFLETSEIIQFTPNEVGIPDGQFSGVLWDLADRGLVEKKQVPEDRRKKQYKITSNGLASVERMDG